MKIIVVYKSSTGFTKTYANWIGEDLNCEVKDLKNMKNEDWQSYNLIVYGSSLMASKVKELDKVKKLVCHDLIVFATGLMSQEDSLLTLEKLRNDNLSSSEQEKIPFYYFEGGVDFDKLGFLSKKMLKMIYSSLKKKANKNAEEIGMMNALEHSHNHTKKENIQSLIENIKTELK